MSSALLSCVTTEGGLLPPDLLQRVLAEDKTLPGLTPADYHVDVRLGEAASRAWNALQAPFRAFRAALERAREDDLAERLTVEKWLLPLFRELGYGWLRPEPGRFEIDGQVYPFAYGYGHVPLSFHSARVDIGKTDKSLEAPLRMSPHGLLQHFLNRSDAHRWGFVTNGRLLRILRDHHSLTSAAYVEIDLEHIFEGGLYSEFLLVFLLCHHSRVEAEKPEATWLERWFFTAQEEGVRALDRLRQGVETALVELGRGFLEHRDNGALREGLHRGDRGSDGLTRDDFFGELRRLVYRILFLFVAEDRDALLATGTPREVRDRYRRHYGSRRLRDLALDSLGSEHTDAWAALRLVLNALWEGEPALGLPALGSGLFDPRDLPHLSRLQITNARLYAAIRALSEMTQGGRRIRVSYRNLGAQELGSVYESLLELHIKVDVDLHDFDLLTAAGHERKTTGSYFTPPSLVDCLLDTALDPVIDDALQNKSGAEAEEALLSLRVCDPACGSGHFLVAAARRMADRLARVRAPEEEPSPETRRKALRDVVGRCLFGVDVKPLAVELCKVSLWMEALEPGRPLSFLNAHIQCGNALLGATPALLRRGIPDEAFEPLEGDDRKIASALKKQNKRERAEQTLDFAGPPGSAYVKLGEGARAVDVASDLDLESIRAKEEKWAEFVHSAAFDAEQFRADLWCAAFVWRKEVGQLRDLTPTEATYRRLAAEPLRAPPELREELKRLREEHQFFHWHLAFPQVLRAKSGTIAEDDPCGWEGGFDVVLGNPPWIAHAGRAAHRLPAGVKRFREATSPAYADFPTTHGMFVHLAAQLLRLDGYLGLILPSSVSDLEGYKATRRAHDSLCIIPAPLVDFGEGRFEGVTQPCMALVSRRSLQGRTQELRGQPWEMARPDLTHEDHLLLERLAQFPPIGHDTFGERGFQSSAELKAHLKETTEPFERFTTPLLEGTDVREFERQKPRLFADATALAASLRSADDFKRVALLVRQTARYPIVATSDGTPFRNSLLAAFTDETHTLGLLLCVLNSSLVRWYHYHRFRDARQPILPQVKLSHLRAIPWPTHPQVSIINELEELGRRIGARNSGISAEERRSLDALVTRLYGLSEEEAQIATTWYAQHRVQRKEGVASRAGDDTTNPAAPQNARSSNRVLPPFAEDRQHSDDRAAPQPTGLQKSSVSGERPHSEDRRPLPIEASPDIPAIAVESPPADEPAMQAETDATPSDHDDVEPDDGEDTIVHPYDPSKTRISTQALTIDLLIKRLRNQEIDLMPDFQRKANLWNQERMSRLVESLLIRLPLPVFYFDATNESKWLVVDGLQRISTINRFVVEQSFRLTKLEYLRSHEGKGFKDLPRDLQRRIEETQITAHLIEPGTPPEVKYNLFRRINTGGLVLTAQEIRHALNRGKAARLLQELAETEAFRRATDGAIRSDRMLDREFVLRFAAFYLSSHDAYVAPMDWFLTDQMAKMNAGPESQLAEVRIRFHQAMTTAHQIFGRDAFRIRFKLGDRRRPVNKALFDSWSVALGRLSAVEVDRAIARRDAIRDMLIKRMNDDQEFVSSVRESTGDPTSVRRRYSTIAALLRQILEVP